MDDSAYDVCCITQESLLVTRTRGNALHERTSGSYERILGIVIDMAEVAKETDRLPRGSPRTRSDPGRFGSFI
ncbi:protein of unknown function [Bradyrhizobium vignae]|uniref:Uncharacterized protein n=1 Tax=Bradyrhizobium vignae TaxID=1549949 RepID=A0A2U3Q6F4_9BRAD|nr:protein of unknown function [Bradyrhizobium vignae]